MAVTVAFAKLLEQVQSIGGVPPRAARSLAAALAIEAGVLPRTERLPPWLRSSLEGDQLSAALRKRRREEQRAWKRAVPSLRRLLLFLPPEEAGDFPARNLRRRTTRRWVSSDPWTLGGYVRALLRHQELLERLPSGDSVAASVARLPRDKLSLAQRMRLQWVWLLRAYGCPLRSSAHRIGALALTRVLLRAFGLLRSPRGADRGRTRSAAAGADPGAEEEAEWKQYRRAITLLRATTSPVREGGARGNFVTVQMIPGVDATPGLAAHAPQPLHEVQPEDLVFVPAPPPAVALGKAIAHSSSYVAAWEALAQDPQLAQLSIHLPRVP
jgi:hypothetical protein